MTMAIKRRTPSRGRPIDAAVAAPHPRAEPLLIPISVGELIDKITILAIKSERITEAAKRENVNSELRLLLEARDRHGLRDPALDALAAELKHINEKMWDIEDEIRDCERRQDFGPRFVELARAVYRSNDERARIKREINELSGSRIVEEKSYRDY